MANTMLAAPRQVRLKRKRNEEPPNALVLTGTDGSIRHIEEQPQKKLRYRLVDKSGVLAIKSGGDISPVVHDDTASDRVIQRRFHLRRNPRPRGRDRNNEVRAGRLDHLPVIEESLQATHHQVLGNQAQHDISPRDDAGGNKVKRPGKGSAVNLKHDLPESTLAPVLGKQDEVQALADSMHEFAMKEVAKESKVADKNKPKMTAAQSRLRHQRKLERSQAARQAEAQNDIEMMDFVYDTYILAPHDEMDLDIGENVAILVIDEQDQEYWQSFIHDERDVEDDQHDEDDEDENAEDHYATEYPEDELDPDDEFDENAYNYRNRAASDDEQYDLRDEEYESDQEHDNTRHPNSMVRQFEQYLDRLGTVSSSQND